MQYTGTGQNHGTDGRNEQQRQQQTHEHTQARAKCELGRNDPHFDLANHGLHRGDGEKDEVQQAIQGRYDGCADTQYPGQASLGSCELTTDIGGGVPARVGVVHVDQRDSKGAATEQRSGLTVPDEPCVLLAGAEGDCGR